MKKTVEHTPETRVENVASFRFHQRTRYVTLKVTVQGRNRSYCRSQIHES
jgi:hypothetical protein